MTDKPRTAEEALHSIAHSVMLRHILPEATPDDAADLAALRRVIDAAEKVVKGVEWHTDGYGKPLGGYALDIDGDLLDALAAVLRGEGR